MDLKPIFENTRQASRALALLQPEQVNAILLDLADTAVSQTALLLAENEKDLARMDPQDPKYDRLKLTAARIRDIAHTQVRYGMWRIFTLLPRRNRAAAHRQQWGQVSN